MIELKHDHLVFSFPEVHPDARVSIDFQRTLRIPDDDKTYALPPGLGSFPLRHVDDFAEKVPGVWLEHGGVMLPMHQAEALWLNFDGHHVHDRGTAYPFAIKIATGKTCAVTGETWRNELGKRPQDYVVVPTQPWLDGYCVKKGVIRQFVAMPLGAGYTVEEQLTGEAEHGGIQIVVHPMKREVFERRYPKRAARLRSFHSADHLSISRVHACASPARADMGLAPGGRMRQEIHADPFEFGDWDTSVSSRCFVHIANTLTWRAITGERPPTEPPTAADYTRRGLPWFEVYGGDAAALAGSTRLAGTKSVLEKGREKDERPLPENESVALAHVIQLRRKLAKDEVREGVF